MNAFRSLVSEFLGTFFLCFFPIAAILSTASPLSSGVGQLGLALCYGFTWAAAVSVFVGISGAHLNPAITAGMLVARRIKFLRSLLYVACQLLGAIGAALLCKIIFPAEAVNMRSLGIPLPPSPDQLPEWITTGTIMISEGTITFFLIVAYFGTVVDKRRRDLKTASLAIGLTATIGVLAAGPITGASMNPARAFGPTVVLLPWNLHWCYWVAPMIAGLIVGLAYRFVLLEQDIEWIDESEETEED